MIGIFLRIQEYFNNARIILIIWPPTLNMKKLLFTYKSCVIATKLYRVLSWLLQKKVKNCDLLINCSSCTQKITAALYIKKIKELCF